MKILELDENISNVEKGRIGEQIIEDNINKNIDIYHKIIRNVILNKNEKKTEVDIILITCTGIFVIESKNFKGYIYGIDFISNNLNLDQSYFYSYVVFGDNSKLQDITITITNNETNNIRVINNCNLIKSLFLDIHKDDIKLSHEQIDKIYIDLKYFYEHLT